MRAGLIVFFFDHQVSRIINLAFVYNSGALVADLCKFCGDLVSRAIKCIWVDNILCFIADLVEQRAVGNTRIFLSTHPVKVLTVLRHPTLLNLNWAELAEDWVGLRT